MSLEGFSTISLFALWHSPHAFIMNRSSGFFLLIPFFFLIASCVHQRIHIDPLNKHETATLAFGSCLRQWQAQPVWLGISSLKPEVFIFLGDNVYTDTGDYLVQKEPQRIQQAYQDLYSSTEYQSFLTSAKDDGTAIYAVWDDHDYGKNDAGADYEFKLSSKRFFLEFFNIHNTVTDIGNADFGE